MSTDFYGPGLAVESLRVEDKSELQALQDENQQLRQEVQCLQELLAVWQPQPCTLCQLHSSSSSSSSSGGATTTNSKPKPTGSRDNTTSSTAYAAVDRILRQQQVLIAQQQRQLLTLQAELSSRELVVLEADAALAETSRRVAALAAMADQHSTTTPSSIAPNQHAAAAAAAAAFSSHGGRRLTTSSSSGGGGGGGGGGSSSRVLVSSGGRTSVSGRGLTSAAGSMQQLQGLMWDHCRALLTWCREAEARITRSKAASAAHCRGPQAAGAAAGAARTAAAARGSKQQRQSRGQDSSAAFGGNASDKLDVPYLPAGGNSFLQQGASLTVAGIAKGEGLHALAVPAVQQLVQQLAGLAVPLAGLAVQLRSIILPALPWVQASQCGSHLPNSCSVLAQRAAATAVQVAQLCAVLPASRGTLSAAARLASRDARTQETQAAADVSSWASLGTEQKQQQPAHRHGLGQKGQELLQQGQQRSSISTGGSRDAGDAAGGDDDGLTLDAEDQLLLFDISNLLCSKHSQAPGAAGGSRTGASRKHPLNSLPSSSSSSPPGRQSSRAEPAAASRVQPAVVQRLQQRLHVLCLKQQVLNDQLSFVAKCSAAQAKLMTQLATDVLQALTKAVDAAEPPSLQQQRSSALQLCSQLQRAALLVQQQDDGLLGARGSSGGVGGSLSSTARTVLSLLESNRDVLDNMPKVLLASGAAALKDAATSAVVAALSEFRLTLRPH